MPQRTSPHTHKHAPRRTAYTLALLIWSWAYVPPVLRDNPIFRKYQVAQFVSYIGTWLQMPAISVLIYELTHNSSSLAISALATILPGAIISALGGRLADLFPTHNLFLATQITLAALAGTLCALQVTGNMQVWLLYVLQALSSAISGLNEPAQAKLVVEQVAKHQLKDALAVNAMCWNLAWMGAPLLAGVIIGQWGVPWLFFANAISYIAIVWYLLRLKATSNVPPPAYSELHPPLPTSAATSSRRTLRDGVRYIKATPAIWLPLLIIFVFTLFNANGSVLQPLIGLSLGGIHSYTLIAASNGIGRLIGSFYLLRQKQRTLRGLLISTITMSSFLIAYGLASELLLAMTMMALATVAAEIFRTSATVQVQSNVPLNLQGRVNGIKYGIDKTGVTLSNMLAGFVLVPAFGPHNAAASSSALGVIGAVALWMIYRGLRRAGKLERTQFKVSQF